MAPYAENTSVSADRSRTEIERTLQRYGAEGFLYGWEDRRAVIQFKAHGRYIRFLVEMPTFDDFLLTPTGRDRSVDAQQTAFDQAVKQRWRAMNLVIKAKLEAVASGITEFEDEFLAHIVLPDGTTAGTWMRPQIAQAYESGNMPSLIPALTRGSDA